MIKGKFIDNLPKVYGIYTGGFLGIHNLDGNWRTGRYVCKSNKVFALWLSLLVSMQ